MKTNWMKMKLKMKRLNDRSGKLRSGLLLWLIGVPLPIILLIYLAKGCV